MPSVPRGPESSVNTPALIKSCAWALAGTPNIASPIKTNTHRRRITSSLVAHFAGRPLAIRSTGPLVDDELVGDKADRGRVHLYEVLLVFAHHDRYRRREHRADVISRFEIELDHSVKRRRLAIEPSRHGEGGNDTDNRRLADDDVFEPGMVAQPVIFELLRIEVITPVNRPDDLQTPKPARHGCGVGLLAHLILVRDHLLHRDRRIHVVRIVAELRRELPAHAGRLGIRETIEEDR